MLDAISENKCKISLSDQSHMYNYLYCKICKRELNRNTLSELCSICLNKEQLKFKQTYLDNLSLESIEVRLKKIEEWIFDNKKSNHFMK